MERSELVAWLRLLGTPGVGNVTARKLLTAFGLPHNIFSQTAAQLERHVSARQAEALCQLPADLAQQVDTTLTWLASVTRRTPPTDIGGPAIPRRLAGH